MWYSFAIFTYLFLNSKHFFDGWCWSFPVGQAAIRCCSWCCSEQVFTFHRRQLLHLLRPALNPRLLLHLWNCMEPFVIVIERCASEGHLCLSIKLCHEYCSCSIDFNWIHYMHYTSIQWEHLLGIFIMRVVKEEKSNIAKNYEILFPPLHEKSIAHKFKVAI